MLMPLPATLRRLVTEYEALIAEEKAGDPSTGRRLADLTYTLCVSTGTREITPALETARTYVAMTAAVPPSAGRGPKRRTIPAVPKPSATTTAHPEAEAWQREGFRRTAGPRTQPMAGSAKAGGR
ncbi:DUF5133 domain-containing protein [Streptomyces sp. NPDC005244]|uniref:DUF5133 domain-containing protein n=1 Tax=Streptomyces sp. NPDC005244 TaxID=3364708 RepID=UPI003674F11E